MMEKPVFIHSLSTRPMLIDTYGIDSLRRLLAQVWYFSLSVAYLKRLGHQCVLHTDSLGKAVLGHLPYSRIELTLDDWPDRIHPRFWAAGKFLALSAEKGPCVHIDGDVFFKRPAAVDRLTRLMEKNDIVTQSLDPACMLDVDAPLFDRENEFCAAHGIFLDGKDANNTGILAVSSDPVRRDLVANYFDTVRFFSDKYRTILDSKRMLTPDLLAEQKMVSGFSDMKGWAIDVLLPDISDAAGIGYQHVYSIDKLNHMPQCIESLKAVDPEIFEITSRICGGMKSWAGYALGK